MTRISSYASPSLLTASLARCVEQTADIGMSSIAGLTRRLATGDEQAFRQFHAQYFDRLYVFMLAITRGSELEAQEALQETLLRVARYVRLFENEDTFWCWLKAVARSAAQDGGRKRRRYLSVLERFTAFRNNGATQDAGPESLFPELLTECLGELEPLDRRLIEGKYLTGSTVKELAAHEGLTEKAVESRLTRLRRLLRERVLARLRES